MTTVYSSQCVWYVNHVCLVKHFDHADTVFVLQAVRLWSCCCRALKADLKEQGPQDNLLLQFGTINEPI